MKRRTLFALAAGPTGLWALGSARAQPLPEVSTRRIERIEFTAARHAGARPVDVWLPADYSPLKRYQVLYMHDGQNLFDGCDALLTPATLGTAPAGLESTGDPLMCTCLLYTSRCV